MKKLLLTLLITAHCLSLHAQDSKPTLQRRFAIQPSQQEMRAFEGNNSFHAYYELLIHNLTRSDITISSLEVLGGNFSVLFPEKELKTMFAQAREEFSKPHTPTLKRGESGILFVALDFPDKNSIPQAITNNITISWNESSQIIKTEEIAINTTTPITFPSPVEGAFWLILDGPGNHSRHRRSLNVGNGEMAFPQRFAVDWVQYNEEGKLFVGDPQNNDSYICYGVPILSVSKGVVVQTRNDMQENKIGGYTLEVPLEYDTVMGNYVLVQIDDKHYALYAHMQPGSVTVIAGDKVSAGQLLGKLGNSGNSTQPHLHFHISSKPKAIIGEEKLYPLLANGLPFYLEQFSRIEYTATGYLEDGVPYKIYPGESVDVEKQSLMNNNLITVKKTSYP